jgi:WhiB family redox-sensing transcriptional regulator
MLPTAPSDDAPVHSLHTLRQPLRDRQWHREGDASLPCRRGEGELWFADDPADVELAKALCQECPLLEACLAGATERREPWGVWGGELFARGVVVPRKRPRGRPRKDAAA